MSCKRIRPIKEFSNSEINRFWRKSGVAAIEDKCWEWEGLITRGGYGRLYLDDYKIVVYSHRASYKINIGDIPDGLFVCHTCDNRKCVNPKHLFLGTCKDNLMDMSSKGRHSVCGEKSGNHKYSNDMILEIRRLSSIGLVQSEIAKKFNVNQAYISNVVRRKIWNHI